jgi:hypothetical protein
MSNALRIHCNFWVFHFRLQQLSVMIFLFDLGSVNRDQQRKRREAHDEMK